MSAEPTLDEVRRLAVLRSLNILDSAREDAFDGLVESASLMLEMPIALVTLVDAHRQWFKAAIGLAASETPRGVAFCAHAIHGPELFEVEDALLDPRFADNPLVAGDPNIRYYAGQPLQVDGTMVGTLCVIDTRPRKLDDRQRQTLARLAAVAAELLTSRRRLVELHDERQRLTDFARASGDWLWEVDAELRYTFVSDGVRPATENSPADLLGQPMADAALLDSMGLPQAGGWHRLLDQHAAFSRALVEQEIEGRLVHVSYSAVPLWGADSRLRGWRGTARDVSSRRQSDLWARQEELLLQRITAQVPGVMFQARRSDDGLPRFTYLSPAATKLFGFSAEAAYADPRLIADRVHRDDLAGVQAEFDAANRDLTPWLSNYRVVLPGKRVLWVETRALPEVTADGVVWNGYTADITERMQAELALRRAQQTWEMAAAADGIGIATLDLTSGRMTLDQRACANHGLAWPQTDFTAEAWLAATDSADRTLAMQALARAVEVPGPTRTQVRMRWPDGSLHTIEFVVAQTVDAAGKVEGLVGTCRDVSERLSLEGLQRQKDAAEQASRAKTEFLSRVSHELRTPLNSVLGFTQLLILDTEHPLLPQQRRQMHNVQHAGRHLLGLIDELLEISQLESKGGKLELRSIDLAAAVGACIDLLEPLARRVGVALIDAPMDTVPVRANPRALDQVLMNLLSNAIKYNRRGGCVAFTLRHDAAQVALSIRDEGPGLTADQQQRLFQPFERLGAERGPIEGSGLGLVITRDLVQAMGGTLGVASKPGVGSTFTLTLEAAIGADRTVPGALFPDTVTDSDLGPLPASRRVLYIEDDPLSVLLMEEVIRRAPPWSLTVARTGQDGLRAARELRPDLVLTDINLPDIKGTDVVAALRADAATAQFRCIALSADAMTEQIDAALAAGFDDYWLKPVDVQQLIGQFERLARAPAPGSPRQS